MTRLLEPKIQIADRHRGVGPASGAVVSLARSNDASPEGVILRQVHSQGAHVRKKFASARSAGLIALISAAACLTAAQAAPQMGGGTSAVQGKVLEARNVEGYTYLKLQTAAGEVWAAVPTSSVKPGAQVVIGNSMVMQNFESRTLNRKFDKILFGQIVDPKMPFDAAPAAPAAASPHAGVAPAPKPAVSVAPMAKASGPDARTVAEVHAGKAALKGKTVSLRAQVVKVNAGIMGKNWLHLQDGTGSASDGSNDVIVTSKQIAAVGDVITARGVVRTNVDLGMGYAYPVLVEDASVQK
jgi:hypothetical protein